MNNTQTTFFPLSDSATLRALEIEHLAKHTRLCWGLWNRGHPFVEVIDHQAGDDGYEVTFRTQESWSIPPWSDNEIKSVSGVTLCRFIQDIYVLLQSTSPADRWHCVLQHHPSPRILLAPAVPVFRNQPVTPFVKCSTTSKEAGFELCETNRMLQAALTLLGLQLELPSSTKTDVFPKIAEWFNDNFQLNIPFGFPSFAEHPVGSKRWFASSVSEAGKPWGPCLFNHGNEDTKVRLQSAPGRIHTWPMHTHIPRYDAPRFNVRVVDSQSGSSPLENCIWIDSVKYWTGDRRDRIDLQIISTLQAERVQLHRTCYPVALVPVEESGLAPGQFMYRLEVKEPDPIFGPVKRPDGETFVDGCLEENILKVVLNENHNPLDFRGTTLDIVDVHENDPNLLILKQSTHSAKEPPITGWLRPLDRGSQELYRRKSEFVNTALSSMNVRKLLSGDDTILTDIADWRSFHPDWRLESAGNVQLVQGPPGTGKTWTATRLVEDIMRVRPESRILLCAKEHLALDHLAESVVSALEAEEFRGITCVRLFGGQRDNRTSKDIRLDPLNIGRSKIEHLLESTRKQTVDEVVKGRLDGLESRILEKGLSSAWLSTFAELEAQVVCVTAADAEMVRILMNQEPVTFDYVIVEEAGKSYPSELLGCVAVGRTTILIGDQMQLPPFEVREIGENLTRISELELKDLQEMDGTHDLRQLARMRDQITRDEPLNKIVQEGLLWLQPFKTLFERWNQHPQPATMMLTEQRRMFNSLSDVVGEVFYGAPFTWMKQDGVKDRSLPSPFRLLDRIIVVDLPHCSEAGEWREKRASGRSLCNRREATAVASVASSLIAAGQEVVCLSPYQGQVDVLTSILGRDSAEGRVFTVDGYQGKESDYVLLSLVRNNEKTAARRWGFVRDTNRLNVALSRAREGLIVFVSLNHLEDSDFDEYEQHLPIAIGSLLEKGQKVLLEELLEAIE